MRNRRTHQFSQRGFGLCGRAWVHSRGGCGWLTTPGVQIHVPNADEGGGYARGDGHDLFEHFHRRLSMKHTDGQHECRLGDFGPSLEKAVRGLCLVIAVPFGFERLFDIVRQRGGAAVRLQDVHHDGDHHRGRPAGLARNLESKALQPGVGSIQGRVCVFLKLFFVPKVIVTMMVIMIVMTIDNCYGWRHRPLNIQFSQTHHWRCTFADALATRLRARVVGTPR